jgi:hypothetical protein
MPAVADPFRPRTVALRSAGLRPSNTLVSPSTSVVNLLLTTGADLVQMAMQKPAHAEARPLGEEALGQGGAAAGRGAAERGPDDV